MPLIVAIEPDARQAAQLVALARGQLCAKLIVAESTERAIAAIDEHVPDLILTSALLSPKDEDALADRLRALNDAAAHVQTLTIPVFAPPTHTPNAKGVLSRLRRARKRANGPDGCDPKVFAEQITQYLERADAERALLAAAVADDLANESEVAAQTKETVVTNAPHIDESVALVESPSDEPQVLGRLIDTLFGEPVPIEPETAVIHPPIVVLTPNAIDATVAVAVEPAPTPPYHDVEINLGAGLDDTCASGHETPVGRDNTSATLEQRVSGDGADGTIAAVEPPPTSIEPATMDLTGPPAIVLAELPAVILTELPTVVLTTDLEPVVFEASGDTTIAELAQLGSAIPVAELPSVNEADAPLPEPVAAEPVASRSDLSLPVDAALSHETSRFVDLSISIDAMEVISDIEPVESVAFNLPEGVTFDDLVKLESAILAAAFPVPPVDLGTIALTAEPVLEAVPAEVPVLPTVLPLEPLDAPALVPTREPVSDDVPAPAVACGAEPIPREAATTVAEVNDDLAMTELLALPPKLPTAPIDAPMLALTPESFFLSEPPAPVATSVENEVPAEPQPLNDLKGIDPIVPAWIALESIKDDDDGASELWMPLPQNLHHLWPPLTASSVDAPASAAPVLAAPRRPARGASPSRSKPKKKPRKPQRPIEDEWGLFDPEQCGFAALLAKLDEITKAGDTAARNKQS